MSEPPQPALGDDERTKLISAGYDAVADEFLRLESAEWPRMRWLERVLDELAPGSQVLDLGCGNGLPATKAVASEHAVVGVDVSRRMIELATKNVPEATFLVGSVESVELPATHFDAVLAFYLFDHVPRDRLGAVLRRIHGWLKRGGLLLATFETADQPDLVSDWLGARMFFSCFPPETTKQIIEDAGFRIRAAEVETQLERTTPIPYLWVFAEAARVYRRPSRRSPAR